MLDHNPLSEVVGVHLRESWSIRLFATPIMCGSRSAEIR